MSSQGHGQGATVIYNININSEDINQLPIGTSASLDYNNLDPHDTQLSSILSNNTSRERQGVSSLNFHRNQENRKLEDGLFIPGQQL